MFQWGITSSSYRETTLWALCPLPRPARAVFKPDNGFHRFASELQQKNKRSLDICFPLTLHLNKTIDSFYLWYLQTSVYAGTHFINPVRLQTVLWEVSLQPDKRSNTMFLLYFLQLLVRVLFFTPPGWLMWVCYVMLLFWNTIIRC